jgi:ribonuclease J
MGKRETDHIPPLKDGDIRVIHLGGVEEIGRNMSLVEYKDTIVVVDCGVQFTETNTPGIDFILPNTRYLEEHKHKIKGVLVTHGHLDHIGAFPYIMPRIGNPPIFARLFTSLMIRKRQEEFPHLPAITMNIIEKGDSITLGDLKIKFFAVSHAIPD